ncbi:peptidase S8 [Bacillus sp. M6-12]|uniref:S8 family serine peptidase n=1 Tax=Bacillus sp. M6-12 TaxID=2054166 RepID=UPI000C777DC2|nr:S8 family serine peptidase [Bacillus sp. M6-12]PLS18341.1 peptidase S8 [Bacillus sp. M6-12]
MTIKTASIILVLMLITGSSASSSINKLPPLPKQSQTEQILAIVTLEASVTKPQIDKILSSYSSIQLRKHFQYALNGFSVLGNRQDLQRLKTSPLVKEVSEALVYKVTLDESVPFIGGRAARGIFDSSHHRLTGKGVKVGVIDTGIDYSHPDLRRSYKGGSDMVDGDEDPMETRGKEGVATSHGTHVAGIIAANGKIKGVAPEAEIIAYRALGPGGMGNTEQVIAAIDRAIKDSVDVLNLSLGNNVNGPDLPISMALDKAVESGITAVTSSGNSGPGVWTVGTPGTAGKSITVGASTPPLDVPFLAAGLGASKAKIRLSEFQGSKPWNFRNTQEVVNGGIGKKTELKHVKNKIALIKRGTLTFAEKINNAQKAGADGVIIFNNINGPFTGGLVEPQDIPAVSISKEDGIRLINIMEETGSLTGAFYYKKEQDRLADFSSRGPVTVNWGIKPDLLAPGVSIKSTVPSGYLTMAGTSMAAPHIAGACALLKQAHPDWGPEKIKSALMTTAKPLKKESGQAYHTFEQGAGRVDLIRAIKADTLVIPASLSFGMFTGIAGREERQVKIIVENSGNKTRRYSFKYPPRTNGVKWRMPQDFLLKPGENKAVIIGAAVDTRKSREKITDGYITLSAGAKEIQLPYLYVMEEPKYPRVMGFAFAAADSPDSYRYEVYLPGGAEEFGIALYDYDSLRFAGYLDWAYNAPRGLIKRELSIKSMPPAGVYRAVIFARKAGRENRIDQIIQIEK